ncbi:phosphotransferase [Cytobacillus firmus]
MNIQEIIHQLMDNNIFHSKPTYHEQLNGGTVSELYLLHFEDIKYVIKKNEPQIIKSEANFLNDYKKTDLLPKLLFVEPLYKYIIYSFIEGTANYIRKNKRETLQTLVQGLLNHYKPVENSKGWGWADQPSESWQSFILDKINEANKILHSRLDTSHYNLVLELAEKNSQCKEPFLLHGDCGVHNFIFRNGELSGVIDPTPVIGEPLYDLIYAFCSSPEELTKETLLSAAAFLKSKTEIIPSVLYEEALVGLYLRMATCIKHHPSDFQEYLEAWDYWEEIVKDINHY